MLKPSSSNNSAKQISSPEEFRPIPIKQKGVSLLELMVAVSIISIISSISYVSLRPLWNKQALYSAVLDLENSIQFFRMKAIIENSTIEMKLDPSCLNYRQKRENQWEGWRKRQLERSVFYSASGSIYFSGNGFASPRTLTLKSNDYSQQLIININGRIRKSEIF